MKSTVPLIPVTMLLLAHLAGCADQAKPTDFGGIGIEFFIQEEYPVIYAIQRDSPADQAGARLEDKIIDIDGKPATGLSENAVSKLLRGAPGTTVLITVRHTGATDDLRIAIQREKIEPSKAWIVSPNLRPPPQILQLVILWGPLPIFILAMLLTRNRRTQRGGMLMLRIVLLWCALLVLLAIYAYLMQDFTSRIRIILNIAFLAGWFVLGVLGSYVSENLKLARLGNAILNVTVAWFIIAVLYAAFLYVRYVVQNPWVLSPTLFVLAIVLITSVTYRFIFPSRRISFHLTELTRYRNLTIALILAIPIAISAAFYLLRPAVDSEAVKLLYSSLFLGFCGLLILTPTLSLLIIERSVHSRIASLLILTTKGLGMLYALMIVISIVGLLSVPRETFSFGPEGSTSWQVTIASSLLVSAVSLGINCVVLTLVVTFQLVDVLKEETPSRADGPRVLFEETRLFSVGFASECCISNRRASGYSEFRDELEENRFGVSRLTVSPISSETLNKYDVLVIARTASEYSNNEMEAITSFVSSGGGLLLMPGYLDASLKKDLAGRMGFTLEVERLLCDATHCHAGEKMISEIAIPEECDEILRGVRKFFVWKGTCIKDAGQATCLCFSSDESWGEHPKEKPMVGRFAVLAKSVHGRGRVVCLASHYQFSNECMQHADNMVLALNIMKWLASKEPKPEPVTVPEGRDRGNESGEGTSGFAS